MTNGLKGCSLFVLYVELIFHFSIFKPASRYTRGFSDVKPLKHKLSTSDQTFYMNLLYCFRKVIAYSLLHCSSITTYRPLRFKVIVGDVLMHLGGF
jgi:hypothetical protein